MTKPVRVTPDPEYRRARQVPCIVDGCEITCTAPPGVVPPEWKETPDGLVCPRHDYRPMVVERDPGAAHAEAMELVRRGAIPGMRGERVVEPERPQD